MRVRSLLGSLLLGTASLALVAGCSGKPENSPVLRKKFAEVDKMSESVERTYADIQVLSEQVRRLTQETSELRAFLPEVDGENAVSRMQTMEGRIKQLEAQLADRVLSSAVTNATARQSSNPATTTTEKASEQVALETAPLAGTNAAKPKVAVSQEVPKPRAEQTSSFRQMTNPPKTASKPKEATKPAPKPVTRGSYHTIETGDTIEGIAKEHGVTKEEILKANRIPAGARLARGQRLYIPAK